MCDLRSWTIETGQLDLTLAIHSTLKIDLKSQKNVSRVS